MKNRIIICLSAMGFVASAPGASISVSFAGDNGGGTANQISPGETAGVVPDSAWTAATGATGGPTALGTSGASVTWSSNNTWGGSGATTDDEKMVNGWLDDGGPGANISIVGIPYANFDVYVYGSSDAGNNGRGFTTNVNGTDYFSGEAFATLSGNGSFFDGSTYVDASTATADPSYFKISGLSGSTLTIIGARNTGGPGLPGGGSDYRGGIAGIQIVEAVPEPSSALFLILSSAGFLGFRRRK